MSFVRRYQSARERIVSREGFTLVEMLVVLAIISILAVLSLPAIKGMLGSMDLKGGANITMAQLELARQTASTRNVPVEVRIYQDTNVTDPNAGNAGAYRIIAVVIPGTTPATDEFVSPGLALPGDIVFDQTATYSTLLDSTTAAYKNDATGNARLVTAEALTAPFQLRNKQFMKITYLPNGTINLTNTAVVAGVGTSGAWCLSLRNVHSKAVTAPQPAPANNYITLVLDPSTGRARAYQP